MSSSSEQKKPSTIVHKPFLTGQINIFNPPKANPNGRLASAKLLTKDRKKQPNNFLLEQVNKQTENYHNPWHSNNASSEANHFPPRKTTFIAIAQRLPLGLAIILVANILSAIVILNQRQKATISQEALIKQPTSSQVGNIDLSAKEFIDLQASSLSSIPHNSTNQDSSFNTNDDATESILPLAIPPLNITQSPNNFTGAPFPTPYYYILSEYTGDRSLALAKEKVPNVSLVTLPEGVFIYMGAFGHKKLAQQFLEQLKQEGFYAYIYPPEP